MKRIRRLPASPSGLASYLDGRDDATPAAGSWEAFRGHAAGESYRQLRDALTDCQRGLCGYCEIDLTADDQQVEHVIPRNAPEMVRVDELDVTNMIACCTGGAAKNLFGSNARGDEERFLPPARSNISCGQAKGDQADADFVDPREIPALPSLLRARYDGRVEADRMACASVGIAVDRIERTISILGLNVERLRRARERHWRALDEEWGIHHDDPVLMEAAARTQLVSGSDGRLARFFTASRTYFAAVGERILAEDPDAWV